ncbi:MAG TPA: hypothetical protein DDW98_12775 [Gammaproteobacteria bacterium]|nr:hypothetical protein [Gammaproteobacteria bacterium]
MLQAALKAMDTSEPPPPGALQQHVDALARFFALDADTAALFALFARVHLNDEVKATRGRTATREHVVHYRIHFETTITASCRQVAAHPAKLHGS